MENQCKPCSDMTALEAALLAADIKSHDEEIARVSSLVDSQQCEIKELKEQNCSLHECLNNCKATNKLLTDSIRDSLGKLRGIKPVCR